MIAPRVLDDAAIEELAEQMRQPDAAARRPARPAGRQPRRRGRGCTSSSTATGSTGCAQAMDEVLDYAERRTRACLAELADGTREAADVLEALDGDLELRLAATVEGDELAPRLLRLAPTSTTATSTARWRSPARPASSRVRVLTDPDIPPSAGAYRPITVIAPEGSLLNARPPPRWSAGNVETSSRVADLVLRAFGRALGQGTMNNLTLGNDDFTYYETLGGGQGACPDADGPSGVHVAMSNTLNTPVEALELEFPLRVVEYAMRRGSAATARTAAATASCARSRRSPTMTLLAAHRAPPPRAARAPTAAPTARAGATCSTASECRPKATGTLRAGRAAADRDPGRRRARRVR